MGTQKQAAAELRVSADVLMALDLDSAMQARIGQENALILAWPVPELPLSRADRSVSLVLCHDIVGKISTASAQALLEEIVRVLAKGGEARVFGYGDEAGRAVMSFLASCHAAGALDLEARPIFFPKGRRDAVGCEFGVLLTMIKIA